jgi:hypothetical protein
MSTTNEIRPTSPLAQLGHRVRQTVTEMNYAARRFVELQAKLPGGDAS